MQLFLVSLLILFLQVTLVPGAILPHQHAATANTSNQLLEKQHEHHGDSPESSPVDIHHHHGEVHSDYDSEHHYDHDDVHWGNDSDHHSDEHGGHGGVHLVSWRWAEYDSIFYFTLIILLASVLKIGFHHMPHLAEHFPETCVLIIFGMILGSILTFCFREDTHHFPTFTNNLFFNVLLPPIILDASYAMYDEDFFGNLDAILMFAVIGTVFNVFLVAVLLFGVVAIGLLTFPYPIPFLQFLVFASIVAAVDPVAVLAIFEEIHVNSVLYFLVFGESILNDGVTIVIYNTMIILSGQDEVDIVQVVLGFCQFFTVVFGGLFVGVLTGGVNAALLRLTKMEGIRVLEPLVIVTSAYFSYILAEMFHWSGIISLIGCGIMQKRYAFLNASKKTYTTVKYTVKTLASVADCIVFIFLGKAAINMFYNYEFHVSFILWTLLFCSLVRGAGVLLLSYVSNQNRMKPISFREQFIMAYGGLRGGVSFFLAFIIDESNPMRGIFLTTTLCLVFFTVFIQGGTIKFMVDKLRITKKATKEKKHIFWDVNKKAFDYLMSGMETIVGNITVSSYLQVIQTFEEKYVKKLLLRKQITGRLLMRLEKITLNEHYARLYGPTVLVCLEEEEKEKEAEMEGPEAVANFAASRRVSLAIPRISTENCLESLNQAYMNNPYEKFKIMRVQGDLLETENDLEESVIEQLNYRTLQSRDIERRLMQVTDIFSGSGDSSSGGEGSTDEKDDMFEAGKKRCRCKSSGEETVCCTEGSPLLRKRACSNATAMEVKKQFLKARKSISKQGRNEPEWHPGQDNLLAPPPPRL